MKTSQAFLRLIIITVSCIFTFSLALFVLRMTALSGPVPSAPVPLTAPVLFATADLDQGPAHSHPSYVSIFQMASPVVPVLELRVTQDRQWILFGSGPLEDETNGEGAVESRTWDEVKALEFKGKRPGLHPLRLEDLLKEFKPERIMVIVHNREVAAAKSLIALLGERDDPKVTLVFAPTHRMNRELRKLRPYWYFGADQVMLTQWRVFANIGLDPLAPTDFEWVPDGFFNSAPQKLRDLEEEFARRKISRVLEVREPSDLPANLNSSYLGVLTNRPTALLPLLVAPSL